VAFSPADGRRVLACQVRPQHPLTRSSTRPAWCRAGRPAAEARGSGEGKRIARCSQKTSLKPWIGVETPTGLSSIVRVAIAALVRNFAGKPLRRKALPEAFNHLHFFKRKSPFWKLIAAAKAQDSRIRKKIESKPFVLAKEQTASRKGVVASANDQITGRSNC
jgi:hypothetical protein